MPMLNFSGNIYWNNIHHYAKFQHCANVNYEVMTFYNFESSHVRRLGFEISPDAICASDNLTLSSRNDETSTNTFHAMSGLVAQACKPATG